MRLFTEYFVSENIAGVSPSESGNDDKSAEFLMPLCASMENFNYYEPQIPPNKQKD